MKVAIPSGEQNEANFIHDSRTVIGPMVSQDEPYIVLNTSESQFQFVYKSGGMITMFAGNMFAGRGDAADYVRAVDAAKDGSWGGPRVTDVPKRPTPKRIEPSTETVAEKKKRHRRLARVKKQRSVVSGRRKEI